MMRTLSILSFALIAVCSHAEAQVTPTIARDCAAKWGSDYEMQLYCRKNQSKALAELSSQDFSDDTRIFNSATIRDAAKTALEKIVYGDASRLEKSIETCYSRAQTLWNTKYCVAMDLTALRVEEARNRAYFNPKKVAFRVAAGFNNYGWSPSGISNFIDTVAAVVPARN